MAFLLDSLKNEISQGCAAMVDYLDSDNMALLENQAHALKSAARTFGAQRLAGVCVRLEENARLGEQPENDLSSESPCESQHRKLLLAALVTEFQAVSAATLKVLDAVKGGQA